MRYVRKLSCQWILQLAIRGDEELDMPARVTIAGHGLLPFIQELDSGKVKKLGGAPIGLAWRAPFQFLHYCYRGMSRLHDVLIERRSKYLNYTCYSPVTQIPVSYNSVLGSYIGPRVRT